jgi:hypothetical protein
VLVGHSGGAALLLAILEHIQSPVAQAILVAGYITPPNFNAEPVLQTRYDCEKIKRHVRDIDFVNSITDPYGCDDKQGRAMFIHLGGTQIIRDKATSAQQSRTTRRSIYWTNSSNEYGISQKPSHFPYVAHLHCLQLPIR